MRVSAFPGFYSHNNRGDAVIMSESPEEQPSTGVLGRIGSWFSPWRGNVPKSLNESSSSTSDWTEDDEGRQDSVRTQAGERQWQEESTSPLGLFKGILPCEEEDATQSAHRDGSVVSSTETGEGDPKEEELVQRRKQRAGQGEGREENSIGTSASGSLEKNVSHLRHLSSSSEQGVAWDFDQAHTQPHAHRQAQTGKRLHVYLEETSVIQCGQENNAEKEVVHTTVKKSFQVFAKAKSSPGFVSLNSSSPTSPEKNVTPAAGAQSYYSTLRGVSLKPHTDSQSEPGPDKEQTEADDMGRRNSNRRRSRKNSQGDGGKSPVEKKPGNPQHAEEVFSPSGSSGPSPEGKSPNAYLKETSADSSFKHNPTLLVSPEGEERKISSADMVKQLDNFQNSVSVSAATQAHEADGVADMDEDDDLYKVERKTETPESKRRSMKFSRSEVKLFTKHVPLTPSLNVAEEQRDSKTTVKNTTDEVKDEAKEAPLLRFPDQKKAAEEPKPVGRIADKISLFEQKDGVLSKTIQSPRSADVSPVRKVTDRIKADFFLPEQRSRSAERYGVLRSSSASPDKEKPMTIKERAKIFAGVCKSETKPELTQLTPALTGTSLKSSLSVGVSVAETSGLGNQGKLDTKESILTETKSAVTPKPDELDSSAVGGGISTPELQLIDSKTKETETKTEEQAAKSNGKDDDVSGDSAYMTNNTPPQPKGPNRTGSRAKRRKNKEPSSPISLNDQNKDKTDIKQREVDNRDELSSASKQLPETTSLPPETPPGAASDIKPLNDTKHQRKESEILDRQAELLQASLKTRSAGKTQSEQKESTEPPVNGDELDIAICCSGTKETIDKEAHVLPQQEKKSEAHSDAFTTEKQKASEDSSAISTPSSLITASAEQRLEEPPAGQVESSTKQPKLDTEPSIQPESRKQEGKILGEKETGGSLQPQRLDKKLISQTETEQVVKLKVVGSKKTNHTEGEDTKKTQQLLLSDQTSTKGEVLHSGQSISGKEGSTEEARKLKTTCQSSEKSSRSTSLPVEPQDTRETVIIPPENAAVCTTTTSQTNEAVSGTGNDKEPQKGETATNVPLESQTLTTESSGIERESVAIAAEPPPDPVSVEKTENSLDDSCTHGANDAGFFNPKPITKAAVPDEGVSVKGTNDTPVLIPAQNEVKHTAKTASSTEEPQMSDSRSSTSAGVGPDDAEKESTVKSMASEGKNLREMPEPALSQTSAKESENTESSTNTSSLRNTDKIAQICSESITSSSTGNETDEAAERRVTQPANGLSPVGNGDTSPHSQFDALKKELTNDQMSPTPKAPFLPQVNGGSVKRSAMKKFALPQELMRDNSSKQQDTPSSWLDVDVPKHKLKVPEAKQTFSGSESNLLDTSGELDDDEFIEKIKKLCAPFSLPPRKHNQLRPPQPPFVMPAIREDRFEKPFDPEEFTFGLRKKTSFTFDSTPSFLANLQSTETKSGLIPARVSVADRSLLLSSLDTRSHFRDKNPVKDGEDAKEERDDQIKVKSRLESSCVLNSLSLSSGRGKRNGAQAQTEGSENVLPGKTPRLSPLPSPQPAPPSQTATAAIKSPLEETQAAKSVVSDSGLPLPSFNDIKLPDYLEKYLPQDPAKAVQSVRGPDQVKSELTEKMTSPVSGDKAGEVLKQSLVLPDAPAPCFPGIPPTTHATLPELKLTQPHNIFKDNKRTVKGFHQRPGKIVLFEKAPFSGQTYEIYRDVADASSLELSPLISVKVVRGCWILYEKPHFQGRTIALEEGVIELENMWAEPGPETEADNLPPMVIGSIRPVVKDYSIPHIDLFTEPDGHGRVTSFSDDTNETGSFGIPLTTASIQVHSGVWLLFSDPGFQGMVSVLEKGVYPVPDTWGFSSPFVGSLRPLKMEGFKVENPNEVKAVVYEKPGFEGSSLEIDSDVFSFSEAEGGGIAVDGSNFDTKNLKSVGSLRVIGGFWVGYSQPGFEGQQHVLEEGEYLDCSDWGGAELLSLRPILSDFMSPHLTMFSDRDFGKLGVNVDLTVPVINMDDIGYGMKTQSIDVLGGVWVLFEEPGFCGEAHILEKGLYGGPEDWGALQHRVGSVMPVLLDDLENTVKFKVQLFSDPGFQGSVLVLEDSAACLQDGFSVASCKVLAGSWLAFESQNFTGKMFVLEEGNYPDLRAMGCVSGSSSILSLQTVGFEFSLPSITLFERCDLRGKKVLLTDGSVNLQLAGGCSRVQSVLVDGGIWILYEGINYRGAQMLLKPGEIPDWRNFCRWLKIGSLRPLAQRQVYFRLRNRQTGLMMSVTGDLDDIKLLRIQEAEETVGLEQIWFYHNGHLNSKVLEECCLSPSGSITIAGSRVGLTSTLDNPMHRWSITSKGLVCYTPTPGLVLEVKGGLNYDKNQVILNKFDPNKLQQRWDVEII